MRRRGIVAVAGIALAVSAAMLAPSSAGAHCDGLDGPVVEAAREALSSGHVSLALVWVQKEDEPEIREAFKRTLEVRALGGEARELADGYFFETLVRIHRAGEGAPYTGLKPAGRDLGPAIPLADEALVKGSVDRLVGLLTDEIRRGVTRRFDHALAAREEWTGGVEAGREVVHAYVDYIHYVERAHEAASRPVGGHYQENRHAAERHDP